MKCKIITSLFMIAAIPIFSSQNLVFRDKNLEKAVVENFDLNKDGLINQFEAEKVENLFVAKKGITKTDDLAYFKNIKMIVLDDNSILDISIKKLHKLGLFSCTHCKASTFTAENLEFLTSVYLDNNQITDISLKSTSGIDQLTISLNKLKAIDVSSLTYLRKLNIEHNQIQQLDISKNLNLESLNVIGNPLKETDIKKSTKNVTIFGFEKK
ncbi:leucine-rich repeat domain-containing protein [Chryseobacterium sp. CFBP8996]|uniref:leucine-rich repeat domain-containing protein n=1 Tax=Chryseobacterium sp. CFBP8996 TaxID=3096529 RepID=UPI002A6B2241|nr:leucine-rich repeat domain-containing protein [Chryseobacterium sp. CFBP8996]MDY0932432.1 leucine-rich repeat domain-containing protein [Chryseobacterium sp. CFBP8996]